jgi:CMP-N,N'-diacetyllegionaminic acid synthase
VIGGESVLAVIAARGGSKGLPRKNLRMLGGRPLVSWPVAAAKAARTVDRVLVSSDDPQIIRAAQAAGADAPFVRPEALATDTATSTDVVRHALGAVQAAGEGYGYVILLEPTSPLTEADDIDDALRRLHEARSYADAIVGVTRSESRHPEYAVRRSDLGIIQPYSAPNFHSLRRRQDIETLYSLDGSLYASETSAFLQRGSFYHERTLGLEMPRWKSLEVDSLLDFICIEAVLANRDALRAAEFAGSTNVAGCSDLRSE